MRCDLCGVCSDPSGVVTSSAIRDGHKLRPVRMLWKEAGRDVGAVGIREYNQSTRFAFGGRITMTVIKPGV